MKRTRLSRGLRAGTTLAAVAAMAVAMSGTALAADSGSDIGGGEVTIVVPGGHYSQIDAGYDQVLALGAGGKIDGWGYNGSDKLGLGANFSGATNVPNRVATPGSKTFTDLSAGADHGLALAKDGHVYAWGSNGHGQLGDSVAKDDAESSPAAIKVDKVSDAVAVVAEGGYAPVSYAITDSGDVWSWGSNKYGLLGRNMPSENASDSFHSTPTKVAFPPLVHIEQVAATRSGDHPFALALDSNGNVWGWGKAGRGTLGDDLSDDYKKMPYQSSNLVGKNFVDISVSGDRTGVAVDENGDVWTWGNRGSDTLGRTVSHNPPGESVPVLPGKVSGLSKVTQVSAGGSFVVALDKHGQAWTWGSNSDGQLGHPGTPTTGDNAVEKTPVKVKMPSGVTFTSVSAGDDFVVALGDDGNLYGWGNNEDGQLGVGNSDSPVEKPTKANTDDAPPAEGDVDITKVTVDGDEVDPSTVKNNHDGTFSFVAPAHKEGNVDVLIYWKANGVDQAPIYLPDGFSYSCSPFPDVDSSNAHCTNISWLKGMNITKPADGKYHPGNPVTRGSMTAFLFRLTHPGQKSPTCHKKPFDDVATDYVFCGYIQWAGSNGVAYGYGDGNFGPNKGVTRGAMAAFLKRIATSDPTPKCHSKPFADVQTDELFCGVIQWMKTEKLTFGMGDGTNYGTTQIVTRQQMASFLHRVYDYMH